MASVNASPLASKRWGLAGRSKNSFEIYTIAKEIRPEKLKINKLKSFTKGLYRI